VDTPISVGIRLGVIFTRQEKGNLLFSSWTITPNTTAFRNNMNYVELVVIHYGLVLELIFVFGIPPINLMIVIVILDTLTNFLKDSLTVHKKPEIIWLDPTISKPWTSKSSKSLTE
jgi:hypothetical protein